MKSNCRQGKHIGNWNIFRKRETQGKHSGKHWEFKQINESKSKLKESRKMVL